MSAAIAAGAGQPALIGNLVGGQGFFHITTPNGIPGVKGKDKGNPSRGSSVWTLHVDAQTPSSLLQDFALVILGHAPSDPISQYRTGNVGLQIDTNLPWKFVKPDANGPTYVAYLLGDLEAGGDYDLSIEYRLGQKLKKKNGVNMFPLYSVAYAAGVPEPGTLVLALGGAAFALMARRAR